MFRAKAYSQWQLIECMTWQEMLVVTRQAGSSQAGKAASGLGGGEAGALAPPSALTMQHQPGASQTRHNQVQLLRYRLWLCFASTTRFVPESNIY